MKPIRGEHTEKVAHDPWRHTEQKFGQDDTAHVLTDTDGLGSHHRTELYACVCGCLTEPGGFCAVCGGLVCRDCFSRCEDCQVPLCPAHRVHFVDTEGNRHHLCSRCHATNGRKQVVRRIGRTLLSFFVEKEEIHE